MKTDSHFTHAIFRKCKDGEVIALFPYMLEGSYGQFCGSYMHIGQHSAADYNHVISTTKPASEKEYTPLFRELTDLGYHLVVIQQRNAMRYKHAMQTHYNRTYQ